MALNFIQLINDHIVKCVYICLLVNYYYKEALFGDDFMSDPFDVLKDALQSVFHLEPMRNGKYIYPEIQQLKVSLDNSGTHNKRSFIELTNAIKAALPRFARYVEKGHLDFNTIRASLDSGAKTLNLPMINWGANIAKTSLKFQFCDKSKDLELFPWLEAISGATGIQHHNPTQLRVLLEHREHYGFSQKLSAHLKKDPDFLFRLIIESEKNFTQIAQTRLVLYLTDQQLAEAIIKHIPRFVQSHTNPTAQAAQLIEVLNKILSNGRSVSTILRNAEAKLILDSSKLLQLYQSGEQLEVRLATPPSSIEEEGLKPTF